VHVLLPCPDTQPSSVCMLLLSRDPQASSVCTRVPCPDVQASSVDPLLGCRDTLLASRHRQVTSVYTLLVTLGRERRCRPGGCARVHGEIALPRPRPLRTGNGTAKTCFTPTIRPGFCHPYG
jgi:hypothetical protein